MALDQEGRCRQQVAVAMCRIFNTIKLFLQCKHGRCILISSTVVVQGSTVRYWLLQCDFQCRRCPHGPHPEHLSPDIGAADSRERLHLLPCDALTLRASRKRDCPCPQKPKPRLGFQSRGLHNNEGAEHVLATKDPQRKPSIGKGP